MPNANMNEMKYLGCLVFTLLVSICHAQETRLLVDQELISDLSSTPIYPRLTEGSLGETRWKQEFNYLDSIEIYRISYMSDGLIVNGLLVKPKKKGKYPCVIFNRGGNREFGSLKVAHGAITLGQIAKEGYIVIASQYRGNAGSEGSEEFGGGDVNDVLALIDVLKEVKHADAERIGMYGWSRGGMMTYISLTKTDKIKAAVVGGAVSNIHEAIIDRPEMETEVLAELIPNYEDSKSIELYKRSAIKWVGQFPKNVPILMLHGTADWRVKPSQSLSLAMEFDKERVPYRLIMFEGGDHGIAEHRREVNEQVIGWFDRFLKNDEALPNMDFHGK